jgi:hypothetical protein
MDFGESFGVFHWVVAGKTVVLNCLLDGEAYDSMY